jgi:hypothetical protein
VIEDPENILWTKKAFDSKVNTVDVEGNEKIILTGAGIVINFYLISFTKK